MPRTASTGDRKRTPAARLLEDGTLMLFGACGDEWDGYTSANIVAEIRSLGEVDQLKVLMNSPGGVVTEGLALYHELLTHPAQVEIEITALAASMASAIAMAGDTVRIAKNGHIMIHDPWMAKAGTAEELRKAADLLDMYGTDLVQIYQRRTGLEEDQVRQMMAVETWLTAEEALELGFVDEIIDPAEAKDFAGLDVSALARVPDALVALIRTARADRQDDGRPATPHQAQRSDPMPDPTKNQPKTPDPVDAGKVAAEAVRAERERAAAIRQIADKHNLPQGWLNQQIDSGATLDQVRDSALDALASRQDAQGGPTGIPSGVGVTADERDKFVAGATQGVLARTGRGRMLEQHSGQRLDPGEFRAMSLLELARMSLELAGVPVRGRSNMEIAKMALRRGPQARLAGMTTTSDFPVLLENVLHKMLMASYDLQPVSWNRFCATGMVPDFRPSRRLRVGGLARLREKNEAGEFRWIHHPDGEAGVIEATTKGVLLGVTRQTVVNDDVDFLARTVMNLGQSAARSIDIDVFELLASNSGLGPTIGPFRINGEVEGSAETLFHATRSNISAGTGIPGIPTQERLEAARVLMARQKDPQGEDFIDLRPYAWVGPIEQGAAVREAIGAEYSDQEDNDKGQKRKPNVVRDLLSEVVDTPRLTGTRWYVFADPTIAPAMEVAFLNGEASPVMEADETLEYDGVRWLVRHDWGVAGIDFRPAVTNAGQ